MRVLKLEDQEEPDTKTGRPTRLFGMVVLTHVATDWQNYLLQILCHFTYITIYFGRFLPKKQDGLLHRST